jgi:hypothetical protein
MGEIVFLLILGGIAGFCYIETFTYIKPLIDTSGGPTIYPRIVFGVLFVFIVIRVIQIVRMKVKPNFTLITIFKGVSGIFLGISVLAVIAINFLGYILTSSLYLIATTHYMYYQYHHTIGRPIHIALRCAICFAGVIMLKLFFGSLLHIQLPSGILKI